MHDVGKRTTTRKQIFLWVFPRWVVVCSGPGCGHVLPFSHSSHWPAAFVGEASHALISLALFATWPASAMRCSEPTETAGELPACVKTG